VESSGVKEEQDPLANMPYPRIALVALLLLISSCPGRSSNETQKQEAEALTGHRFSSNITILHEVEDSETETPLVLNTHEILPLKPLKKKCGAKSQWAVAMIIGTPSWRIDTRKLYNQ